MGCIKVPVGSQRLALLILLLSHIPQKKKANHADYRSFEGEASSQSVIHTFPWYLYMKLKDDSQSSQYVREKSTGETSMV